MTMNQYESLISNKRQAPILTPQQFKDLVAVTASDKRNGTRNAAIIWVLFIAGARISEVAKLKVKDVIRQDGKLLDEVYVPGTITKTGKPRCIYPSDKTCKAALERYIQQRIENKVAIVASEDYRGLNPESSFFIASGGKGFALSRKEYKSKKGNQFAWVATSLQLLVTRLLRRVGVTKGSSHCGRRTFATRLYHRTAELELVSHLLGHATLDQTVVYIEADRKAIKRAAKAMWPKFEDKL